MLQPCRRLWHRHLQRSPRLRCLPCLHRLRLAGAALAAVMFMMVRPEDFGKEKSPVVPMLSEFLGTYILVLTVGLNVLGKSPAAAFSIAASLMSMIYALGDVSGAHFNPAVTVAILASGMCPDLTPVEAGKYIATQIAGGVFAGFTYMAIYGGASFPLGPVGTHTWSLRWLHLLGDLLWSLLPSWTSWHSHVEFALASPTRRSTLEPPSLLDQL